MKLNDVIPKPKGEDRYWMQFWLSFEESVINTIYEEAKKQMPVNEREMSSRVNVAMHKMVGEIIEEWAKERQSQ